MAVCPANLPLCAADVSCPRRTLRQPPPPLRANSDRPSFSLQPPVSGRPGSWAAPRFDLASALR
jgi:hypothetical protein